MSPQQQLTTATLDPVPARHVEDIPVAEEMSDSFLAYALSVITSRAIPDVRDGLKPVQRRVLWSMLQMGLRPGTPYRKSARVVGDTMGRYHPHGDAAIYDTLVRMGQEFSRMVTLVDPQGNFGSLDDPPAAARYTECRLSEAAMDMVGELDEDTVDFRPTYDGEDTEPVVLPAALPNLLVNGTAGIAVGMATTMLPHNLAEVGAAIELVMSKQPSGAATGQPVRRHKARPATDELMAVLPGPDFPGGGIVVADEGLKAAYDSGRGSIRVRARASIEAVTRRRRAVVVTELPHLVGPERVVSRITELVGAGRLQSVAGIADLSDMEGLRLQIDLKPGIDPATALSELYRLTPLEESVSVNNVVLVDGVPTTVGLRELCEHYVAHRLQVVVRRTRYRLRRADERLHVVEGLLVALDNIDEVVALIRASQDAAEARAGLMARYGLTEVQANHILDMALRRLTALERQKLDEEAAGLRADIEDLNEILSSRRRQRSIVRSELRRIVADHGRPRRSRIVAAEVLERESASRLSGDGAPALSAPAEAGPDLPCVVTVSTSGNIGRASLKGRRRASPGRHDLIAARAVASTGAPVAAVTSAGRVFTVLGGEIEETSNRVRGVDASTVFDLESAETVLALVAGGDDRLVMVTAGGVIKRLEADEVLGSPAGSSLIALGADDRVACAFTAPEDADVVVAASDGRALRLEASSVRLQRRAAAGMAGMKLRDGATPVGAGAVFDDAALVVATSTGAGAGSARSGIKVTPCSELPTQGRGTQGVLVVKLLPAESVVAAAVGAAEGMLALMGQDDNPRKIDPHPVPVREAPSARYRSPQRGDRRIHVLAPGRW